MPYSPFFSFSVFVVLLRTLNDSEIISPACGFCPSVNVREVRPVPMVRHFVFTSLGDDKKNKNRLRQTRQRDTHSRTPEAPEAREKRVTLVACHRPLNRRRCRRSCVLCALSADSENFFVSHFFLFSRHFRKLLFDSSFVSIPCTTQNTHRRHRRSGRCAFVLGVACFCSSETFGDTK